MGTVSNVLMFAEWWLYFGAAVAFYFLTVGIERIDENARGAYVFRPLLIPGVLLIWPLVLWRIAVLERNKPEGFGRYRPLRTAHGYVWLVLFFAIPAIFVTAMLLKQTWPADIPAVRLSPAEAVSQ